ncbi:hypothetical protein BBJ28_00001648 [Nothophytophthora sp. Chile5]|nr:hypothetical protein BBJ28_00001648 [Nothophytophthora sp. Chile5]
MCPPGPGSPTSWMGAQSQSHSVSNTSTSSSVKFPLSKGHFGDVHVSMEQEEAYRALVRRRVDALLADEQRYAERQARHKPRLDPSDWKFVRSHEELKLYRRRRRGRTLRKLAAEEDFPEVAHAVESGQPSIVALGRVAGSIEDLIYGCFDTTQEEMQTNMAFTHEPTDCALLRVLELDAPEDPLHYLGLKWTLNKMPMKAIVTPRDTCYLNAMGMESDSNGQRYGYMVLHSVELPECPPFDRRRNDIIRGKLFFTCLFRETSPGFVNVILRGIFDLSGDLPRHLMSLATASFIGHLFKAGDCAEAKKLTLLARHNAVSGFNLDALNFDVGVSKDDVCSVCIKHSRSGLFSGVKLRSCRVCGVAICSKCSAKNKRMFLGSDRPCSFTVCCPNCVLEAQEMTDLRPSQPEYAVVADFYLHAPALESYSGAVAAAAAHQLSVEALSVSEIEDSDWWEDKTEGGSVQLPSEGGRDGSASERPTTSTFDESWVGRDFMDGYAATLSDLNAVEYRFSSSAEEEDELALDLDRNSEEQWHERAYEEEIEVDVRSTPAALAALLRRAAVIGSQVQQTDSAMRELQRSRVRSRRPGQ